MFIVFFTCFIKNVLLILPPCVHIPLLCLVFFTCASETMKNQKKKGPYSFQEGKTYTSWELVYTLICLLCCLESLNCETEFFVTYHAHSHIEAAFIWPLNQSVSAREERGRYKIAYINSKLAVFLWTICTSSYGQTECLLMALFFYDPFICPSIFIFF